MIAVLSDTARYERARDLDAALAQVDAQYLTGRTCPWPRPAPQSRAPRPVETDRRGIPLNDPASEYWHD